VPPDHGTVIAGFGRSCLVRPDGGELMPAHARNRRIEMVAGDRVQLLERGVVEAVAPRRSAFVRASEYRTKVLAANVTQIVIIAACEPSYADELICRMLVAAERSGLRALVALNKVDLAEKRAASSERLDPFRVAGYQVIEFSAKFDAAPLRPLLQGERTVLAGQSGMGKSTLVRALVPDAEVRIGEISRFLDSGRQSTIVSRLYTLDAESEIVDTPGVSEFGLAGLAAREIAEGFREFAPLAAGCRFNDCRHLAEPSCAVRAAAGSGAIHPRRLELYERIVKQERAK
jgi:ribosome biogenesis GTPase